MDLEIFNGEELLKFFDRSPTDEACYTYLSEIKRYIEFSCKIYAYTKFSIRKAFFILFEIESNNKRNTCLTNSCEIWCVKEKQHKVRMGMKSSQSFSIDGIVYIDEYLEGGKENNIPRRSYEECKFQLFFKHFSQYLYLHSLSADLLKFIDYK